MSNETLAQYLSEAVITRRAKPRVSGPRSNLLLGLWYWFALLLQLLTCASICSVFLLAATNTFLHFIDFKFGSYYGEYFDATNEMSQKVLIDDENRDTFICMHNTKWFDLQSPGGRKTALCHILAIVRGMTNKTPYVCLLLMTPVAPRMTGTSSWKNIAIRI